MFHRPRVSVATLKQAAPTAVEMAQGAAQFRAALQEIGQRLVLPEGSFRLPATLALGVEMLAGATAHAKAAGHAEAAAYLRDTALFPGANTLAAAAAHWRVSGAVGKAVGALVGSYPGGGLLASLAGMVAGTLAAKAADTLTTALVGTGAAAAAALFGASSNDTHAAPENPPAADAKARSSGSRPAEAPGLSGPRARS